MMKIVAVINHIIIFEFVMIMIMGKIRAISTSKIKKIMAIIKNRREKGRREEDDGSNPHSNGEHFSRSVNDFFDRTEASNITIDEIIIINNLIIRIARIIYTIY